jgi:hypothetical protein
MVNRLLVGVKWSIHVSSPLTAWKTQLFPYTYYVMWQETDRPSFLSLYCHLLTHTASPTSLQHVTQCHRKNQCEIPYAAKFTSVHLKQFLDMDGVDFHHRTSITTLIIAHHTVPARCKYLAWFDNMWPGHHITAIWFHKLLMNTGCRYFQWQQKVHNSTDF